MDTSERADPMKKSLPLPVLLLSSLASISSAQTAAPVLIQQTTITPSGSQTFKIISGEARDSTSAMVEPGILIDSNGTAQQVTANPTGIDPRTAAGVVGIFGGAGGIGPFPSVAAMQFWGSRIVLPESPRMTRLKQLAFDRRPSAMLKAWAENNTRMGNDNSGVAKTPLDLEMEGLQKQVTRGDWLAVKEYLKKIPLVEAKAAYQQLLQSLQSIPAPAAGAQPVPMIMGPNGVAVPAVNPELHQCNIADVIGLASASPGILDSTLLTSLGHLLRRGLDQQTVPQQVVDRFQQELTKGPKNSAFTAGQAAQILMAAEEPILAGAFLPEMDRAIAEKDSKSLNLLARHFIGTHAREKKSGPLEKAWLATQAVLAHDSSSLADKQEAVLRAIELAPQVKEELGQTWLDQSFTKHPERGMDILASIGSLASRGIDNKPMVPADRLKVMKLQTTVVEALLKAAPQLADQWKQTLNLMATAWMREAEHTRKNDRTGPRQTMDRFGRRFWVNEDPNEMMMMRQQNQPLPIKTDDLLRTRPEQQWIAHLDTGTRAKLSGLLAQLYLKVQDENKAFPFIEELIKTNKEAAQSLVNEFLTVWTTNHDPNGGRQDPNSNLFFSGFGWTSGWGGTPEGIPLTRSKQERNLVDLAEWVARLRKLPLQKLDEDLLVNAFTKCHSTAEVYRLDAIEKVFGPLDKIKPRTLATLMQNTRANLAGLWRLPAEQQNKKTNRKLKDIQVEVLRGYDLAGKVVDDALKQFPEDWSLTLAKAALLHDETNYRHEVARNSEYSRRRTEAIANFQKAASLYAANLSKLSQDEESIEVYQQWYYASLGACDLGYVNMEKQPDPGQPELIRKAILGLSAAAAERHMNKLARGLFVNMSAARPEIKHRYLEYGFKIVGDNKEASEARKVYDYYRDLVTEIKLDVIVDGSDKVGHKEPFGVFVNLRHSREIEREAGGFGKYLQNQNSGNMFFYNFGRPITDYRDRFQAATNEALKEQFDVISITYQSDKVHSRAASEYGWRVTPYAYLLLKPRGPQVDKIPSLHMDLDFSDTSGYVILPVASPAVPLDASLPKGDPRPVRKLQITQILDERQANLGKLGVEIKATGLGLIGDLDSILNFAPEGFEISKVNDPGVSIAKYDENGENTDVVSERTWLVDLRARGDRTSSPSTFHFGSAKNPDAEMIYQRYQDADLANAEAEVSLENSYRGRHPGWLWGGIALGIALITGLLFAFGRLFRKPVKQTTGQYQLPNHLTPFTVTALLRQIQKNDSLTPRDREVLDGTLQGLEQRFFADASNSPDFNLKTLAEDWVRKVK